MRVTVSIALAAAWLGLASVAGADVVADLGADWSDARNPNAAVFGTWSYRQGTTLLPEVSNWNGAGTVGFTATQPAWAPSDLTGSFLPAAFKALSVPSGVDWRVGDVVVHTTDAVNGGSNGPVNFLWTSPSAGTVTISGSLWDARFISGRDNAWTLFVDGVAVSSGASIEGVSRAHPFSLASGTGGLAALTRTVVAGTTIDLQIAKTTFTGGNFVGVNLAVASVPEPNSLVACGLGASLLAISSAVKRRRRLRAG